MTDSIGAAALGLYNMNTRCTSDYNHGAHCPDCTERNASTIREQVAKALEDAADKIENDGPSCRNAETSSYDRGAQDMTKLNSIWIRGEAKRVRENKDA